MFGGRMRGPLLALLLLSGCSLIWRAPVPMRAVDYPAYPAARAPAKCLIVFLPGMGDDAEDFEKNGFVEEVRRHGLSVDIVAANATIGYYSRGIFADRLEADVIAPRRTRGYQQTWLIGPSMGGFGSLFYSRQRTSEVTGVLALAPFLGDKDLIEEVHKAGGLGKWQGPARVEKMNDSNYQREMLRWLQMATHGKEPAPILNVGFGRADKLAYADELLAAELPQERVYRTEGGHHWGPWRTLLAQFLDRGELAQNCRN
jgi:pimeloyl-ACP methyl ester carboxylesterase